MSVALALYKGKGELANSLIRWKSKSIYSHCELVVDGWMYSSTVRDGGVRCKLASLTVEEYIGISFKSIGQMGKRFFPTIQKLKIILMAGEI